MGLSFDQVSALVESELARNDVPEQRRTLGAFIVTPTVVRLTWQYGDGEVFDAWLVGRSADSSVGLVHCPEGVGGTDFPWGAVLLDTGDMGMDR